MTKVNKYENYKDTLRERPDIVQYILKQIDENPVGSVFLRAVDIRKELGPKFEKVEEENIYWGLKVGLSDYGIFVSKYMSKDINPKTNQRYVLLSVVRKQ